MRIASYLLLLTVPGCAAHPTTVAEPGPRGEAPAKAPTAGKLSIARAGAYMLELVNRDRRSNGLAPVAWDDVAAKAGRVHAEDMARHGYTGHIGTDGSVPELRYTRAGGTHYVQENAACVGDAAERALDQSPLLDASEIEQLEAAFMHEKPPNDGHRKNILTPWHTHLGVGFAKPAGVPVVCLAQELTDHYGSYAPLPATERIGRTIEIAGELNAPATFGGVGLARIALPRPRSADELNGLRTYRIPQPYVSYFPKGLVTPVPVEVKNGRFVIRVPLSEQAQTGVYEVSVWAHVPGTKDLVMVSLRTIVVK